MSTPILSPVSIKPAPHLYFVNAPVDFALIGGASILTFALIALLSTAGSEQALWFWAIAAALTWVCNYPHFAATSYRLYHSKENISQYPVTAIAVPLLVIAGMIVSFVWPAAVAPFFVKLFLLWSGYHYSGQSVGISLIYARRAGFVVGRLERLALSGFIFGTYFSAITRAETSTGSQSFYGISYPTFGLPVYAAGAASAFMWFCGAALLLLVIRWSVLNRRLLPPVVLLPAAAQLLWFVLGSGNRNFTTFVPFFHSLQYLLIAWSMQLKERMDTEGIAPSGRYVLTESARWGAIIFVGGAFLFWLLPHSLASSTGVGFQIAAPIVLSGVQIHHFFVDGVIWKLRNPRVTSPLLVNIEQLMRPASQSSGLSQPPLPTPVHLPIDAPRPASQLA